MLSMSLVTKGRYVFSGVGLQYPAASSVHFLSLDKKQALPSKLLQNLKISCDLAKIWTGHVITSGVFFYPEITIRSNTYCGWSFSVHNQTVGHILPEVETHFPCCTGTVRQFQFIQIVQLRETAKPLSRHQSTS